MSLDIYGKKKIHKNLHEELCKLLKDYSRNTAKPPLDEVDLYQLVNKLLKKHNYCTGGCQFAEEYFNANLPNSRYRS